MIDKRKLDITRLSLLAHLDEEDLKRRLPILGYEFIQFIDTIDDMQGFLAKVAGTDDQVLIFRQSEAKLRDWLNNANAFYKEVEDGVKYHNGYYDMINRKIPEKNIDVWNELIQNLTDLNIVIGGFSQAGGLAEVMANLLFERCGFTPFFIGIDSPAVIDNGRYNNGIYMVNSNSIVPIMTQILGYEHYGDLIYYTLKGRAIINPSRWVQRVNFLLETAEDIVELIARDPDLEHNLKEIDMFYFNNIDKISRKLLTNR